MLLNELRMQDGEEQTPPENPDEPVKPGEPDAGEPNEEGASPAE